MQAGRPLTRCTGTLGLPTYYFKYFIGKFYWMLAFPSSEVMSRIF